MHVYRSTIGILCVNLKGNLEKVPEITKRTNFVGKHSLNSRPSYRLYMTYIVGQAIGKIYSMYFM